jgi:hypothetical protein
MSQRGNQGAHTGIIPVNEGRDEIDPLPWYFRPKVF